MFGPDRTPNQQDVTRRMSIIRARLGIGPSIKTDLGALRHLAERTFEVHTSTSREVNQSVQQPLQVDLTNHSIQSDQQAALDQRMRIIQIRHDLPNIMSSGQQLALHRLAQRTLKTE